MLSAMPLAVGNVEHRHLRNEHDELAAELNSEELLLMNVGYPPPALKLLPTIRYPQSEVIDAATG